MCRLVDSREKERGGEGSKTSLPVDPAIPRRFVPDFRTRQSERRIRSAARTRATARPQMEKKKEPGFTSRSRANERDDRGVRGRVQIVFGGQG